MPGSERSALMVCAYCRPSWMAGTRLSGVLNKCDNPLTGLLPGGSLADLCRRVCGLASWRPHDRHKNPHGADPSVGSEPERNVKNLSYCVKLGITFYEYSCPTHSSSTIKHRLPNASALLQELVRHPCSRQNGKTEYRTRWFL